MNQSNFRTICSFLHFLLFKLRITLNARCNCIGGFPLHPPDPLYWTASISEKFSFYVLSYPQCFCTTSLLHYSILLENVQPPCIPNQLFYSTTDQNLTSCMLPMFYQSVTLCSGVKRQYIIWKMPVNYWGSWQFSEGLEIWTCHNIQYVKWQIH